MWMIFFIIINKTVNLKKLLDKINRYYENIQFAIEEENNWLPAYLNVKIIYKKEYKPVDRKPTAILEIIHSTRKNPQNYRLAALNTYINRVLYICSIEKLFNTELKTIEKK